MGGGGGGGGIIIIYLFFHRSIIFPSTLDYDVCLGDIIEKTRFQLEILRLLTMNQCFSHSVIILFCFSTGTLEETSGSVTHGTLEPKNAVTNDPNDKSTSSVKSQPWTPVTDARATSEVRGSHGKYGVRSADDAISDVQGSDGKFWARDEAESEDEEEDDDDDDRCLGLDENIPAVEDLVPPAKRLFPGRPVPRPAPTVGSSAAGELLDAYFMRKVRKTVLQIYVMGSVEMSSLLADEIISYRFLVFFKLNALY